jgi:hypothetical protein
MNIQFLVLSLTGVIAAAADLFVFHKLLGSPSDPSHKLAWVFVLLVLPIVGAVFWSLSNLSASQHEVVRPMTKASPRPAQTPHRHLSPARPAASAWSMP